jgi:hypothetical protein
MKKAAIAAFFINYCPGSQKKLPNYASFFLKNMQPPSATTSFPKQVPAAGSSAFCVKL